MAKYLRPVMLSIVVAVIGIMLFPIISSALQTAAIVPLEYKYVTYPASSGKTAILKKFNAQGLDGWEVSPPVECDDVSCTTYRMLFKRPK